MTKKEEFSKEELELLQKVKDLAQGNSLDTKPEDMPDSCIEALANTDKTEEYGMYAVLFAMSDGKGYTEKQIDGRVKHIQATAAIEVLRRKGFVEVKNFGWLSNWEARMIKMQCPRCLAIWEVSKEREDKNCPFCNFDILKMTEEKFPNLKKHKK